MLVRKNAAAYPADIAPLFHLDSAANFLPLERSILQAVSYADVFDFPLTAGEIHYYLVGLEASRPEVQRMLDGDRLVPRNLERHNDLFSLPGRTTIVKDRQRRADTSAKIWPSAVKYGRLIAQLPFVRMVAVTGALAINNAALDDDMDYLIVTEPGRLWLCRSLVILMVRFAARRGDLLCPNYFLSENSLALPEHDLFTAHELLQMVPVSGLAVYKRMLRLNSWAGRFLPNAYYSKGASTPSVGENNPPVPLIERVLRTTPGDWFETWEMERKITKFSLQERVSLSPDLTGNGGSENLIELSFSADRCKGHFNHHGRRALKAYKAQLQQLSKES